MTSSTDKDHASDRESSAATTVPNLVMAEQITHDVVKEAQSMGVPPIDVSASTTQSSAGNGEAPSGPNNLNSKASDAPATTNAKQDNTAAGAPKIDGGDLVPTANTNSETRPDSLPKETKEHEVNGDTGEHSAPESQTVTGDGSGGSDTDISRPGSVDQAKRPEGHVRTNSAVKKPTSFKSVSVTKNFLAKSAVTVPAARSGDKVTSAAQSNNSTLQSAKPRLVAKSGGSNVPRSLGKLNGAGSGPDASKVWNKNQPVPPPPPKQFTDEELKQQYGIHLATRLQADDGGKEAKWADIDDDEDDWAPETVEWMDGTKSTVTAVESQPPVPEEPAPAPKQETPTILAKPPAPAATSTPKPSVTGGTKTILKPGAHAQASTAKNKGQQDKPTLVAKPSAAAPVKSPWASLPPVDKVSPVQINPPVQQQPPAPRFSREGHGYDSMSPLPAKEIAPDDFNRSWRDERGNRELFNSHNGRYEPVGDVRRGSLRDGNYRQQPAVLQRPSHDGPAEPSAAFQTSRTSGDLPNWGRRRNSSNVSGGSGRRMSFDRRVADAPMSLPPRRESISINGADAGGSGSPRHALPVRPLAGDQQPPATSQKPSPSVTHAQPASPFGSVASQDAVTPGGLNPMQNLVEVQQRLLHGSLDLVKQRKLKEQEEEARKEAEKKERLRKKLEALAPTEEVKPKAKEQSPARLPQKSPQKEKAVPAVVQSTPKPPVPTSEGEVAQYGMMKVHQPHPVKKPSSIDATAPKSNNTNNSKRSPSPKKLQTDAQSRSSPSPSPAHVPAASVARDTAAPKPQPQQSPAPSTQPKAPDAQAAKSTQPPQVPWNSSSLSSRGQGWTSSVWGPPQAMNRALGNGTFTQQVEPQPSAGPNPAPIGTNPSLKSSTSQAQAPPNQPFAQQTMYTQTVTQTPQAVTLPAPNPIAPPNQKGGWGNFQAHIRRDDRETIVKTQEKFERMGGNVFRPEMRETFVDPKGQAQASVHTKPAVADTKAPQSTAVPDAKPKEDTKIMQESTAATQAVGQSAQPQTTTQGARSSRFFPRPSEPALQASAASNKEDLAPPPETEAHPAFSGDTCHPVVKMPRPQARVRLPPAATEAATHAETPVSMPSRKPVGIGARPLALTQEWQARFNSLLEKPSAPTTGHSLSARQTTPALTTPSPKTGALAIAPSSKAPLEVRLSPAPATVSLPAVPNRKIFINDGSRDITSRIGAEYLLEDREFGSVPTVKLSQMPHLAANEAPAPFPTTPRQNPRYRQNMMDVQSSPPFEVRVFRQTEKDMVTFNIPIKLGNMQSVVTKSLSKNRNDRRGSGQQKPKRNFNGGNDSPTTGQHPRQRKPSNYQGQNTSSASSPRTSTGNAWSGNRSTPNNLPWGRRQTSAAPVH